MLNPREISEGTALVKKIRQPRVTLQISAVPTRNPAMPMKHEETLSGLDAEIAALHERKAKILQRDKLREEVCALELGSFACGREGKQRLKIIFQTVCEEFQVPLDRLLSVRRQEWICLPRFAVYHLARTLTDLSLNSIGAALKRDHGTVACGIVRIDNLMQTEPGLKFKIDQIEQKCRTRFNEQPLTVP